MNYKQKKEFLLIYRDQVKDAMKKGDPALNALYHDAMKDYHAILDHNLSCLKAHVKINKILTAYIIDRFQIVQDAYVYDIDPVTGIKAV